MLKPTPIVQSAFQRRVPAVLSATGAALVLGGAVLFGTAPAALGAVGCPVGSSLVSAGVCEISFTESGTFTPPAGVTKLEALLVGAGGAANSFYAGGGGEVKVVELLPSGAVTVTVGAGGTFAGSGDGIGGITQLVQALEAHTANGGGRAGLGYAGNSGNGNPSGANGGGGAGGAGAYVNGGDGVVVSTLASTLFTDADDCYGGGGAGLYYGYTGSLATCGGGYTTNIDFNDGSGPYTPNTGSATVVEPVANSGGGGSPSADFSTVAAINYIGLDGADGYVALRFNALEQAEVNTLATTGVNSVAAGGAAVLLAAGAFALAFARRLRRS